jgi:ferredoxin
MKFKVDEDLCIGCGVCESECDVVFEMQDDAKAHVISDPVPADAEADAEAAEESCPTDAISHK